MAKRTTTATGAGKKAPKKSPKKASVKSKAGSPPKKTPASSTGNRRQLDRLDREIVEKINARAQCALDALESQSESAATAIPDESTLARAARNSKGPLSESCIRAVLREVISGTRALHKTTKVAFLGPAYSYSHLAAVQYFGQSVDFLPLGTISSVFEEVHEGQADYGIVPIENSTDGRIADTLDNFVRHRVKICAEVNLPIHHNLLAMCRRNEVKEVYSRPQALSQCRKWLATHLPSAQTIEVTSTATAAQLAKDKKGAAAIASLEAGTHCGLNVLAAEIEDNRENLTRFAVISDQVADRTGEDKTSVLFQVSHKPGSLADAMAIFKRNRINMSWIESFPIGGSPGKYLFFVELNGHESDTKMRRALQSLEKKSSLLEVLGSYAKSPPVE